LVSNGQVKITDVSGHLVFETKALGGKPFGMEKILMANGYKAVCTLPFVAMMMAPTHVLQSFYLLPANNN
jgi:hypothetical protein